MKTWNTPSVEELNINATADGWLDFNWESPWDIISKKKSVTPDPVNPDPVDPEEPADKLS